MSKVLLLDTNAAIARIAQDAAIIKVLEAAAEVFLSSVVLGELFYGAENSTRSSENYAAIEKLAADTTVLVCDTETARHYAHIRKGLKSKGKPIPPNDMWVAAVAKQHQLTLLTRDRHFHEVEGILLQDW
ncbi:MAG: type II toxin-antitoxin system VapC family toxin [bacterium]|nr:type II toxin-antitoxin system VapC family toxin [bacterium]